MIKNLGSISLLTVIVILVSSHGSAQVISCEKAFAGKGTATSETRPTGEAWQKLSDLEKAYYRWVNQEFPEAGGPLEKLPPPTIHQTDHPQVIAIKMSVGDNKAYNLALMILEEPNGLSYIQHLSEINARGERLLFTFYEFAQKDFDMLINAIQERDVRLSQAISQKFGK